MPGIHDVVRPDDVSGQIVGRYMLTGVLTYDGRQQGSTIYAETDQQLMEMARAMKAEMLERCGQMAHEIYPADDWRLRII